ncbi:biliverdin-producing heme oxygenase [Pararobbsia silviterrae]|uniref:Heme oxygenase n=1 Tax=Pararobbsia silviterrae TaxID=1792498 RepID=A0A494XW75_9BURK|nr:biliverdin-producing heme oxygenase [Pararobbsia silviterrae]RKP54820.1 heme oxygenase [Pararobbsia silviterrae]
MHDTLMPLLKSRTADAHRRLEAALDLMRDDLTLEDYGALISAFHGFIAAWEHRARARIPAPLVAAFDARCKTAALRDDLQALGRPVTDADPLTLARTYPGAPVAGESAGGEAAPAPFADNRSTRDSTAAWLGSWYVIEGATLGGQFLAPHFSARFGLTPDHGVRYFSGYGPRTGSMWNAFRALLVEFVDPAAYAHAAEGALQTFVRLHAWMAQAGVTRDESWRVEGAA